MVPHIWLERNEIKMNSGKIFFYKNCCRNSPCEIMIVVATQ